MSDPIKKQSVMALRLVAAQAEKAADDLDRGRLWEGDINRILCTIHEALRDVQRDRE